MRRRFDGFSPDWSREGFRRRSPRQAVRLTAGGGKLRVRLSNAYGTSPVRVAGATVARTAAGAAGEPGSIRRLTFAGALQAAIPARGHRVSDASELAVGAWETLTGASARPPAPAAAGRTRRRGARAGR
ncbi:hypothetical protein [Streptomyces sp. NPDC047706]|uniref:hypothetical protein n=1 Tax=Streptomyces sp. NPDC047706 TaxID=3365486 RepID=UPI00370FB168